MKRAALALVVVLAGCDSLFNLDHVPPPGGGSASGDDAPGPTSDALRLDAGLCGLADEDADGLGDGCDLCPTAAGDDTDADGDGLPDACDPNLGILDQDKILFVALFSTEADLTDNFTALSPGVSYDGASSLILLYGDGDNPSTIVTNTQFAPTKIELRVAGMTGGVYEAFAAIVEPSVTCEVHGTGCDMMTADQTCFFMDPIQKGAIQGEPSTVNRIELFQNLPMTSTSCRVNSTTVGGGGPLTQSAIQIMVSPKGSLKILSMVVYGSKA